MRTVRKTPNIQNRVSEHGTKNRPQFNSFNTRSSLPPEDVGTRHAPPVPIVPSPDTSPQERPASPSRSFFCRTIAGEIGYSVRKNQENASKSHQKSATPKISPCSGHSCVMGFRYSGSRPLMVPSRFLPARFAELFRDNFKCGFSFKPLPAWHSPYLC